MAKNLLPMQAMPETRKSPWCGVIPWRRTGKPTPVLLSGKPMGGGAWWAAVHGVAKELDPIE